MYPLNWGCFEPVLIVGFMKDIESSDLISKRYISEIDEVLVSTLNLSPSFPIGVFMVLQWSGALMVHQSHEIFTLLFGTVYREARALHGLIFRFICDDNQYTILHSLILLFNEPKDETLLFDFFSNPQRSHHHTVDYRTHNTVTECCFSYILNARLPRLPGIHHWASKSKRSPWLWRRRKPKGVITDIHWLTWLQPRKSEDLGSKKLEPFRAFVLALKYLPFLLDGATRSEELIALANMWSYRYPPLVSLFPYISKVAGRAVECYLFRFDRKEGVEVAVSPPLPSSLSKLKFADRNHLIVCLTPPSEPSLHRVQSARELATSVTSARETPTVIDIP